MEDKLHGYVNVLGISIVKWQDQWLQDSRTAAEALDLFVLICPSFVIELASLKNQSQQSVWPLILVWFTFKQGSMNL